MSRPKDLKATVDYVLGSTVQNKDHKDRAATVRDTKAEYIEYSKVEREELYGLETEGNPDQWKEGG